MMREVVATVAGTPGEPASDQMLALVRRIQADNPDAEFDIVPVDVGEDPAQAVELGVLFTPTLVTTVDGDAYDRMTGLQSHRAVLQSLLPVLYPAERALSELRRQLDAPGERFPRRSRRRTGRLSQRRRLEMLRRVGLFGVLTSKQLKLLATSAHEIILDPDSVVIEEGQPGDSFFVLVEGDLAVERAGRSIARLETGECFGEMSLLDDQPRSATVTTLTEARLLALDRPVFQQLVMGSPEIALALMAELAHRLRVAQSN
jgi:hypothetical protein